MKESVEYLKFYLKTGSEKREPKNVQVNIRISEKLLSDLNFISELFHVDRSEWMRIEIAKAVHSTLKSKESVNFKPADKRFIAGEINNEDFKRIVGFKPPKEILEEKKKQEELNKKGTDKTKEYLKSLIKKN